MAPVLFLTETVPANGMMPRSPPCQPKVKHESNSFSNSNLNSRISPDLVNSIENNIHAQFLQTLYLWNP
jgi:hypothetical protein